MLGDQGASLSAVRQLGDPVLRTPAMVVTEFDDKLVALEQRMFSVMERESGVGLAAPQIGVALRMFVMDCDEVRATVINPELEVVDPTPVEETEGCLSIARLRQLRERAKTVTVRGVDVNGDPVEVIGTGYVARCLQHEYDHLQGRLFTDPVRK